VAAAVVALCRAGFEPEAAADLAAAARAAQLTLDIDARPGAAFVVAHAPHLDVEAWRRAVRAHPPVFTRSHWAGTGPHTIATAGGARPDRIAPLTAAFTALDGDRASWLAPWIEYPDTNDGKALSTLARALDARLAGALRERGLVADGASHRAHVLLVDGTTAYVGTSDALTGSRWPLGIPRLRVPREAPSRSTQKLAEAIAVFLGDRENELMHAGQAAVDLGAAPGGWTWQLLSRGLQVTAVDNAALAPPLARDANVEHVRADGLAWRPRRPVDWLVCDIVERPARIASLVADWVATGAAASAIFNLKLPMKKRHDEVARCAATIHDRLAAAGVDATLALRQLYHDREEVTGYLARRERAHSSGRMPRRR
jgi:23S rRNA (cytidine2498-2'-O)-methyltransferase